MHLLLLAIALTAWHSPLAIAETKRPDIVFFLADDLGQRDLGAYGSTNDDPARLNGPVSPRRTEKPNIVFILSDDQGWNDIGYHGSAIQTPVLDRLAAEGVRLNRHYVYPTCSPTRVALLTGRNPARFNVFAPLDSTTDVAPQDMRLPFTLQALGYTTHISGKWHIGETPEHRPLRYGFTTSYGYLRGQIDRSRVAGVADSKNPRSVSRIGRNRVVSGSFIEFELP